MTMVIRINDVPARFRPILEKADTQPKDGYIADKEVVPAANAVVISLGLTYSISAVEAEQFLIRILDVKNVSLPRSVTSKTESELKEVQKNVTSNTVTVVNNSELDAKTSAKKELAGIVAELKVIDDLIDQALDPRNEAKARQLIDQYYEKIKTLSGQKDLDENLKDPRQAKVLIGEYRKKFELLKKSLDESEEMARITRSSEKRKRLLQEVSSIAIRISDVPVKYRTILEKIDTQPKDGYIADNETVPAANAVLAWLGLSKKINAAEANRFLLNIFEVKPVPVPLPVPVSPTPGPISEKAAEIKITPKSPNNQQELAATALMKAVVENSTETVKLFLDQRADMNLVDKKGITPLMRAVGNGNPEIVKLFLDHGADINFKDKDGNTLLMGAAMNGNFETTQLLLNHGAKINAKNKDGRTALMGASWQGYPEIVKLLLDHGADINLQDSDSIWSALIYAMGNNQIKTLELLLDRGADVNLKDNNGYTALIIAVIGGQTEVIKLLLSHGADVNAKGKDGKTAFDCAKTEEIKKLLKTYKPEKK